MNNRALTLSLVMAAIAVYFVYSFVSGKEEEMKKRYGSEMLVLTASRDVKEMETINEKMFELKAFPKLFVEPAAISFDREKGESDKDTARSLRSLVGSVAMVPIKKGEQITYNKLTEPSIRTGLSPQITPGRRAIAINVSDQSGVAKLVKPGDRVDLIAVIDMGGGKEAKIAKTVLQDVVVLATGRAINNNIPRVIEQVEGEKPRIRSLTEDPNFTTVTLEVEPTQAQMMALVQASGDTAMWLSLRNNDDTDRTALGSHVIGDVLGPDINRIKRGVAGK